MEEIGNNGIEPTSGANKGKTIEESIRLIAEKEGFTNYTFKKENLSTEGGSYQASLFTVDITGQTVDGEKELNLFGKKIINTTVFLPIDEAYARENYVYIELAKQIEKLQDQFDIPQESRYKMVKHYNTNNPDLVIMENMEKKGFKVMPIIKEKACMSLEYAETSIKELAKLHGLYFALRKYNPEASKRVECLKHPFELEEMWEKFVVHCVGSFAELLDSQDKTDRVKNYIPVILEKFTTFVNKRTRISTLCHGDYKINNILTKTENGSITAQLPIDYQIIYYGNPINDVVFFIFTGTDRMFRAKHLDHLKEYYYKSLETFLKHFKIDIQDVCPRNVFDEEYKIQLEFGLMVCLQFLYVLLPPEGNYIDLEGDFDCTVMKIYKNEFFEERLNEVVDEFIEWGYL